MPDHAVEASNWLAGIVGTVGAALGLGSMSRMSRVRDQCNEHDVKIRQLDEWVSHLDRKLDETHDLAVQTNAKVDAIAESTKRIEDNLNHCQAICRGGE